MRIDSRVVILLVVYGCLLLIPTWQLSLIESTEARYGEIAREMLVSGNFLEPTFNGVFHFHKPPVPYWLMAGGMALFGVNDFGVRFFGIIAAVLTLFFLYQTALSFFDDRRQALSAMAVLASSVLFIAVSRIVSTDIYLTSCVAGALYFLFRQVYGERTKWNAAGYGLFLGIGFMVKGPVVFLFTLLPQMFAKLTDQNHRRIFSPREVCLGLGCFIAIALPWYIAVIVKHPDLFTYFTKVQTVDRAATDRFGRNKPFWFFIFIFSTTFLPYTFPLLRGTLRLRECPPRIRALFLYIVLPLIIFSISKSKLHSYILPFYGTAAILVSYFHREMHSEWDNRLMRITPFLLALVICLIGFISAPLHPIRFHLAAAGVSVIAVCASANRLHGPEYSLTAVAGYIFLISVIVFLALPYQQKRMKSFRQIAEVMNELDPGRHVPTIVFRSFLPSISFYRQKLAFMAFGKEREVTFETDYKYRQWYIQTDNELKSTTSGFSRMFLVTERENIQDFTRLTAFTCSELQSQKRYTAYDCRSPDH